MSASLKVDPVAVAVTGVTDVARRHLLGSGAAVAFTVSVSSASAASGIASGITSIASDSSSFVSALNSNLAAAGLPACSGVAVSPPVVAEPPALNLSSVDVSAAVSSVTTAFGNLTASAAVEKQTQLLSSMAVGTANVSFSQEAASAAASIVLAVVTAAPGVVLSVESQNAALDVLTAVSSAKIDATSGVGQTITSALDSVATSALSGGNSAALLAVQNVIGNLAASQAASLLASADMTPGAPPPAPATTRTATIQTLVQVDPPGGSRLTSQPLTAPGSPSSFSPMPADLLPTDSAIVTNFFSLAFDPNGGSSSTATTGVTRLAFANPDGSPIEVADASTPIRFTLPPVDTSGGEQAACMFWDTAAKAYSAQGCAGVPNPSPPGHVVSFFPNFTVTSDAEMVLAWNISGPMVDDGSCFLALLDCGAAEPGPRFVDPLTRDLELSHASGLVYPDPRDPLGTPAVACPNATTTPPRTLRVYYGADCALWRPDNAYNCSWDNVKQSFIGGGCVAGRGPTQCMCRHLTDFASARTPKIATCSLADMTSFSAADIVTKLKFLFIVVIALFGACMHGRNCVSASPC